ARSVAAEHAEAIRRLARINLRLSEEQAPEKGVKRSTPEFDLVLDVPAAKVEALKKSLEKEVANLERLVANSKKQLANEQFVSRAPAHVVEGIRKKLADYEAQLARSRATLAGL
ncbi:MAG TPA: valine--tRNA ligase, partial [Bryobacterales bacterium]|nr:valine--tRNA ligase [Bryobacterales bacterium]